MKRLLITPLALVAPLALAPVLAAAQSARGARDAAPVRNVVLVHGAYADGSSYAKVIPLLEARGQAAERCPVRNRTLSGMRRIPSRRLLGIQSIGPSGVKVSMRAMAVTCGGPCVRPR